MKNVGKKFEENWKSAIPENVMYFRIPDPPQSFEKTARFSNKPPFDCFMYTNGKLFCLELKTSKTKGFSFERTKEDKGMIHYHQIQKLLEYDKYDGIISGLVLNFRKELSDGIVESEVTYFIHIQDFKRMIDNINKKSFTLLELLDYSPIRIQSTKKRTNFTYDIDSFIYEIEKKYYTK